MTKAREVKPSTPRRTAAPKPTRTTPEPAKVAATRGRPPRAQGRPGQHNIVGRDAIIEATRDLLRVRTPAAMTLKEVATHAGFDVALIRYYSGNKDGLLTATAAEMMAQRQSMARDLLSNDWPSERRLRERITTALKLQLSEPNFHRLVVEQLFSEHGEAARRAVETIAARGLALEVDLLAQSKGKLRAVDPRFLNLCILGICEFFASAQPLVESMFAGQKVDEKLTRSYIDFVVDLLMNGLSAEPPQS